MEDSYGHSIFSAIGLENDEFQLKHTDGTLGQNHNQSHNLLSESRSSTSSRNSWPYLDNTSSPISSDPIESPHPPNRSIYALQTRPGYCITIIPYQNVWPLQSELIQSHLHTLFTTSIPSAAYTTIEHIGSASIPGLAAKPNIDVLVTFSSRSALEAAIEALDWEIPETPPYVRYTRVPNGGGIQGRESFKLYVPNWSEYYYSTPERSVYLIEDTLQNWQGQVQIRCYGSVRETLRDPANEDLLNEYGEVKTELGNKVYEDSITYSRLKNDVIRKVLRRSGWTEEEIDAKERLSERIWIDDDPAY